MSSLTAVGSPLGGWSLMPGVEDFEEECALSDSTLSEEQFTRDFDAIKSAFALNFDDAIDLEASDDQPREFYAKFTSEQFFKLADDLILRFSMLQRPDLYTRSEPQKCLPDTTRINFYRDTLKISETKAVEYAIVELLLVFIECHPMPDSIKTILFNMKKLPDKKELRNQLNASLIRVCQEKQVPCHGIDILSDLPTDYKVEAAKRLRRELMQEWRISN